MGIDEIRIKALGKRYGLSRALAKVSLILEPGLCVVLGPNGAGKSTLLGIVSTTVRKSSGTIGFFSEGKAVPSGIALRREIGLLAHDSFLYEGLNAVENLQFWARLYDLKDQESEVRAALAKVGLQKEAWTRQVGTYSRGMVQRLALAKAMLHKPSLLLLDEPFTGLDRQGSQRLVEALEETKAAGAVILVITHELEAIAKATDHVAILAKGQLVHEERGSSYSFESLKALYHQHT